MATTNGMAALSLKPDYIDHRIKMFDELKLKYDAWVASQPRTEIEVTLPDGKVILAKAWESSPMDIAKGISKSLSEKVVIAKVDNVLWDLNRVFEKSCKLQLLDFSNDEGKMVFWHSSAHVLGEACELNYGCHLCIGPPIEEGFYYEMAMDKAVQAADYDNLHNLSKKAINEKQVFERLTVTKENLLEMFKHNKYKIHIINDKIPDGSSTTVYRCGPLIDLCYGPHIPHTGKIKAFKVTKVCCSS
jgi:threonyl-tRNA synthetase